MRSITKLDLQYAHRFYGFKGEAQYLHGHTGVLTIEDAPAYFTFYMTVVATDMVVTVGAPWNLKPADFAHFR